MLLILKILGGLLNISDWNIEIQHPALQPDGNSKKRGCQANLQQDGALKLYNTPHKVYNVVSHKVYMPSLG